MISSFSKSHLFFFEKWPDIQGIKHHELRVRCHKSLSTFLLQALPYRFHDSFLTELQKMNRMETFSLWYIQVTFKDLKSSLGIVFTLKQILRCFHQNLIFSTTSMLGFQKTTQTQLSGNHQQYTKLKSVSSKSEKIKMQTKRWKKNDN